ncbi:MAG: hypothetical protein J7K40_10165 [candidate division Zixibacteria bacterium]|nr:hypothetical protein [candidate division Zixibacteria bacterium]
MPKRISLQWGIMVIVLAIIFTYCVPVKAGQFSADLVISEGNNTQTGKIFVSNAKYRLELTDDDKEIIVIVDTEAAITKILLPAERKYMEYNINDPFCLKKDPFQYVRNIAASAKVIFIGRAELDEMRCDKYIIKQMGQKLITQWVSPDITFPIKIIIHTSNDKTIELKDIKQSIIHSSLLEVLPEYQLIDSPEKLPIETPNWAKNISSAPVVKPPFEQDMSVGDIIRVKVAPGKSFVIKGTNKTKSKAIAKAIPFKKGKPVKDIALIGNFIKKGTLYERRHETPKEADEIVIYMYEGEATISGKHFDMHEKSLAAGEEFRLAINNRDEIEARFINLVNDESVCVYDFLNQGQLVSEGPLSYRTITLDKKNEAQYKTLRGIMADEIVVKVKEGKILLKIGQYDAYGF